MAQRITVVAGPAGSGKTRRLLEAYRRAIVEGPPASVLWLAPNHRSAADVRTRILSSELGGCVGPGVMTFDQLGRTVLATSALVVRPLDVVAQRDLLQELIAAARAASELEYFAPIVETSGFLDLVAGFIRELKRLEIWPAELAKACGRKPSPKDRELCRLYDRYQQLLTNHQLYDAEGSFWAARTELARDPRTAMTRVRQIFVDGFTDFTRTEHEILEILTARAEATTITLPMDDEDTQSARRGQLFAKCRATLEELKRRHAPIKVEWLARRKRDWAAMEHLEKYLFANPRDVPQSRDTEGLEILAAAGVRGEIELVAQRIKSLLTSGQPTAPSVRPADVLVVFRSLAELRELVVEVFDEYGIPLAIEGSEPLARSPVLSALAAWLRLDDEDWPFHAVRSLLVHNHFRPRWHEWREGRAAQGAEWLVRRLQVPSGRVPLVAQAKRLFDAACQRPAATDRTQIEREALLAWPLLERIATTLDQLPRRATPRQWSASLASLATEMGLLPSQADSSPQAELDRTAWRQWTEALESAERTDGWLDRPQRQISRRELAEYLAQVARHQTLAQPHDDSGRVRVLSAETARNISAPYVFVAGLSERSFPAPSRDDCLMSDAQVRNLADAGLPLVPRHERSGFEMLLFYEIVTRATQRLTLSYPALDQAAQPLAASPYVTEVERVFAPSKIERCERFDPASIPSSDDVLSPRELRLRAVAQAMRGESDLLVEAHRDPALARMAPNIVAALVAGTSRRQPEFGPYEGLFTSAAAKRALAARFGPEYLWSPSRLEQYAMCPFQFFAERVLGLTPMDDPALATDYARRGQMLHALLSQLHRGLNERVGALATPGTAGEQEFAEGMAALVEDLLTRMRADRPLADGLLEIDARRLSDWLARYRQQHIKYDASCGHWDSPPRPAYFEPSFGHPGGGDDAIDRDDPLSSELPLILDCGGESIRFAGRIDRIDVGELNGQLVFNVIDYKSSARAPKFQRQDELYALQLPLYALAAEQLLADQGAMPFRASYWHVGGQGAGKPIEFATESDGQLRVSEEWKSLGVRLRRRVAELVRSIRRGQFPVLSADDECTSRCSYHTICRVNQVRALGKTWSPVAESTP